MTQTVVVLSYGTGSWTVPAGVTTLDEVEAWGGGGSGGYGTAYQTGGGGGEYAAITNVSVTPGASITVSIGAGGAATTTNNHNGNVGAATWFSSTSTLYANGASAGQYSASSIASGPAGGGTGGSSVGTTKKAGGAGGACTASGGASGGGAAGSPSGTGGAGTSATTAAATAGGSSPSAGAGGAAGAAGTSNQSGGGGGGGQITSGAAGAGGVPGGGGGGGGAGATPGAGGNGQIRITYTNPTAGVSMSLAATAAASLGKFAMAVGAALTLAALAPRPAAAVSLADSWHFTVAATAPAPAGSGLIQMPTTVVTLTAGSSWTVPAGVTILDNAEAWGAGASGAYGTAYDSGGGGGCYVAYPYMPVTPGAVMSYLLGAGGAVPTSSPHAGNSGAATWFGSTTTLYATGGSPGIDSTSAITSGAAGGGTGTASGTVKNGGGRAGAVNASPGASGGGAAGSPGGGFPLTPAVSSAGAGPGGSADSAGAGGAVGQAGASNPNGGGGGGGQTGSGAAGAGGFPGGGGGAGVAGATPGAGAAGQVRITYRPPGPGVTLSVAAVAPMPRTDPLAPASVAVPHGVFSVFGTSPIPSTVFTQPFLQGVSLQVGWATIQATDAGDYDWSSIDVDLNNAVAAGKQVTLCIVAGVDTPGWVYTAGAASISFPWYLGFHPPAACTTVQFPLPWDATYLTAFTNFISAMGSRYASNPAVTLVKLTGINVATDEVLLPFDVNNSSCGTPTKLPSTQWLAAGYRPSLVVSAWQTICAAYAAAFPTQRLQMSTGGWAFPPIDDYGVLTPGGHDYQLRGTLAAAGLATIGPRFWMLNGALSAVYTYPLVPTVPPTTPLSFQTIDAASTDAPTTCRMNGGVSPCDAVTMMTTVVADANTAGAQYLEAYQPDVLNPALTSVLSAFVGAGQTAPVVIAPPKFQLAVATVFSIGAVAPRPSTQQPLAYTPGPPAVGPAAAPLLDLIGWFDETQPGYVLTRPDIDAMYSAWVAADYVPPTTAQGQVFVEPEHGPPPPPLTSIPRLPGYDDAPLFFNPPGRGT